MLLQLLLLPETVMYSAKGGKQSQDLGLGLCHDDLLPCSFQATPSLCNLPPQGSLDIDTSEDTLPLLASLASSLCTRCVHPVRTC